MTTEDDKRELLRAARSNLIEQFKPHELRRALGAAFDEIDQLTIKLKRLAKQDALQAVTLDRVAKMRLWVMQTVKTCTDMLNLFDEIRCDADGRQYERIWAERDALESVLKMLEGGKPE